MKNIRNKKAVSAVITTVIILALSIALIGIVWVVVDGIVKDNVGKSEACFNIFEKVGIDETYTCYNSSGEELKFMIFVRDIELEKILVSIKGDDKAHTIELSPENILDYVGKASGDYGTNITFPESNSGKTYYVNNTNSAMSFSSIDLIEIIPVVGEHQCSPSDSLKNVNFCS